MEKKKKSGASAACIASSVSSWPAGGPTVLADAAANSRVRRGTTTTITTTAAFRWIINFKNINVQKISQLTADWVAEVAEVNEYVGLVEWKIYSQKETKVPPHLQMPATTWGTRQNKS